jgi:hypothetical protein
MDQKAKDDAKKIEKRRQKTLSEVYEKLQEFEQLGVAALNDEQKAFIRARKDYLSDSQKSLFKKVLEEKVKEPKEQEETETKAEVKK